METAYLCIKEEQVHQYKSAFLNDEPIENNGKQWYIVEISPVMDGMRMLRLKLARKGPPVL